MATIGLSGQVGSLPDPQASVRAIAPYQAGRSVAGNSGLPRSLSGEEKGSAERRAPICGALSSTGLLFFHEVVAPCVRYAAICASSRGGVVIERPGFVLDRRRGHTGSD